jgi:hypothetical protein
MWASALNPSAYISRPQAHATPRLIAYRQQLLAMKHRKGRSAQLLAATTAELEKRPDYTR